MSARTRALSRSLALMAVLAGCRDGYAPNYLYRGEWIDIDGQGRGIEQSCAGSFAFVDSYAGALAREFGAEAHLGDYRWYSSARFETELPCNGEPAAGCTSDDHSVSSDILLLTHELVHLAQLQATDDFCPNPLGEGLAEYYATNTFDMEADGVERIAAAFADPTADIAWTSYGALGRFMAFLVAQFGLEAVLDVCRSTGREPSAEQLSAAIDTHLGSTTTELLTQFEVELGPACDQGSEYESRVYACGVAEAAPDAGSVGPDGVELHYPIDCANPRTVGPLGDRVWIVERIDLEFDGDWVLSMTSEDAQLDAVTLTLASCEPCGRVRVFEGEFVGPEMLGAGRYWIEVNAPADFVGTVVVRIDARAGLPSS